MMEPRTLVGTVATVTLELVATVIAVSAVAQCVGLCERVTAELATIRDIAVLEARLTRIPVGPDPVANGTSILPTISRHPSDEHVLHVGGETIRVPALTIIAIETARAPVPHVRLSVAARDGTRFELAIPFRWVETER